MKVEKNHVDDLNALVTLTIEKEDYIDSYNKKLKEYSKKAQLKGFRKGKIPVSVIKKMYGSSAFQESVSEVLSNKINEMITGDEFNIIGEPYLVDRENVPDLDHKNPEEYTYTFELGLEPEIDIDGIADTDSYQQYKVEISEGMIDEEVNSLLKRLGEQKSVDTQIIEGDIVYFHAVELAGSDIKVDGHESEFSVAVDRLSEQFKSKIISAQKGDKIEGDIYNLEDNMKPEDVVKYFLKVAEGVDPSTIGKDFKLEIVDVIRVEAAEMNQDTLDKCFGEGEVANEQEARDKIKDYLEGYFGEESNKLVNRSIMEELMERNTVPLPEGFLKKWINLDKEEEMTPDQFEGFKKELKWRIIKKKLVKQFEVEVVEEEIFNHFVQAIKSYSPYIDEGSLKKTVFSLMQNREQVNKAVETISSGKLFEEIRKVIKTEEKGLNKDEFNKIVKELNQKAA